MEFLKYYPEAIRIAKKLTRDSYLAEDIVQDVFLRIIKNGITIDGEKNYKGYLNTAIRNNYFTHLHKKKLGKFKGVNVEIEKAFEVSEVVCETRLQDSLTLAVKSTKSALTLPLILHVVHDYSYEEISKIMAIPLGTVRTRIHHAKKALKEKIAA